MGEPQARNQRRPHPSCILSSFPDNYLALPDYNALHYLPRGAHNRVLLQTALLFLLTAKAALLFAFLLII